MKRSAASWSPRIAVVLIGGIVVVVALALTYFAPQMREYHDLSRYSPPNLWLSPKPLADRIASTAPGTQLSYFGYKFEVPWAHVVKELKRLDGRQVRLQFESGQEVIFWDPALSQSDSQSGVRGSKYEHLNSVLSFTPSDLSPFASHANFVRQSDLSLIKGAMFEHSGATGLFKIETPAYKGFEVSGLSYNGRVGIDLFDAADHQFLIEVRQWSGRPVSTTQQDINRLIQSFGPTGTRPWVQDALPTVGFGLFR